MNEMKHRPEKEISVAFSGGDNFSQIIGDQLHQVHVRYEMLPRTPGNIVKFLCWHLSLRARMSRYSVLHLISPTSQMKILNAVRNTKLPIVCHWIGSDVLKLNRPGKKKQFFKCCPARAAHIAVSSRLAEELAAHAIEVKAIIPIMPSTLMGPVDPLPAKPAVLCYWMDKRAKDSYSDQIIDLAGRFPEVPFYILKAQGRGLNATSNVKFLGYQESVKPHIQNSTCYIRLLPHDGEPILLAECLAMGRYVLYNHPKPACEYVKSFEELPSLLSGILQKKEPNYPGVEYIKANIDPPKIILNLKAFYELLLGNHP